MFDKPYPLTPDTAGMSTYTHNGTLRGGSGHHVDIVQPASSGEVTLLLTDASGNTVGSGVGEASRRARQDPVRRMIFLVAVAALFAGYGAAYLASDDVRYLTRAGVEETHILQARRPIADLVADKKTDPALKGPLQLVLESRNYAASLGLQAKETYTTYADVGRDTLLLVLQASPKDCLCAHTWKYPIVGRIPYKGFFDPRAAQREADSFRRAGLRHLSPAVRRLFNARLVQ